LCQDAQEERKYSCKKLPNPPNAIKRQYQRSSFASPATTETAATATTATTTTTRESAGATTATKAAATATGSTTTAAETTTTATETTTPTRGTTAATAGTTSALGLSTLRGLGLREEPVSQELVSIATAKSGQRRHVLLQREELVTADEDLVTRLE